MIHRILLRFFQHPATLILLILAALVFTQPGLGALEEAQDQQEIILTASAGYGGGQTGAGYMVGIYKENQWIPVRITLESGVSGVVPNGYGHAQGSSLDSTPTRSPGFEGWLEVFFSDQGVTGTTGVGGSAGSPARLRYQIPVSLASMTDVGGTTARKEFILYVFPEYYSRQLTIQLIEGKTGDLSIGVNSNRKEKVIASTTLMLDSLSQSDYLVGVMAETPSAFNSLSLIQGFALSTTGYNVSYGRNEIVHLLPGDLPENDHGLYALDVLVMSGVDTGMFSPGQVQALEGWVATGGQLILTGGANWQNVIRGIKDSRLLPLIPNTTQWVTDLSDLNRFLQTSLGTTALYPTTEEAGVSNTLVPDAIAMPEAPLAAASGVLQPGAQILASSPSDSAVPNAIPLVVRKAFGEGSVILITLDATHPVFRTWPGITDFYQGLLSYNPNTQTCYQQVCPPWSRGIRFWSSAESAATIIPEISLPSALLICGFLAIYVAVIGPLNYLLLRVLKRREWGWLSIPAWVIIFSVFVLVSGNLSRGTHLIQNRVVIVRSWPEATAAEVDGVLGLYSPRRGNFSIETGPGLLLHPMSGFGLNTGGIGANSVVPNITFWQSGERNLASGSIASNVRIDVGGIRSLAITGSIPPPEIASNLHIQFSGGARLEGTIINQSSEQAWEDLMLLTPGGVIRLAEDFLPGDNLTISESLAIVPGGKPSQVTPPIVPNAWPGMVITPSMISATFASGSGLSIEDILGTSNYYDDPELYRRYLILASVLESYSSTPYFTNNIYLAGWSSTQILDTNLYTGYNTAIAASTPLNAWLNNKVAQKNLDTAFYLIKINAPIEQTSEAVLFSPGDFRWQVLDSQEYPVSPYGYTAYAPTKFSLEFIPIYPLTVEKVNSLSLNLVGDLANPYGTTPSQPFDPETDLSITLYDWREASWVEISTLASPGLQKGMNEIPNPEAFVASDGRLRVQVSIMRAPFELSALEFYLNIDPHFYNPDDPSSSNYDPNH